MNLAKSLLIDSVSRLQPTPPLQVGPERTVAETVDIMRQEGVGCVLVCAEQRLVGIFTERDLLRRVMALGKPLTVPITSCMTADPVVVHPKDPISVAISRMQEGGYRHLPVVDEAGSPVGVLSVKRIVHYLVEHFPTTVYNLPPNPGAIPNKPEGA
ncbi:MAG: cyclic nucleotide-binding/CBS domain-containing protein [Gemmataceae bacterium]